MNIDGLVYLLNQAGNALSQADQMITQLKSENTALREALAKGGPDDKG